MSALLHVCITVCISSQIIAMMISGFLYDALPVQRHARWFIAACLFGWAMWPPAIAYGLYRLTRLIVATTRHAISGVEP